MNSSKMNVSKATQNYFTALNLPFISSVPSIDFLSQMQKQHIAAFSFNSLAVNLNQTVEINSQSVFDKIVTKGLGGYCFEHNKLIFDVLNDIGFNVRILMARVVNNQAIDSPRTHRLSLVTIDNEQYIIDGGFGHYCPRFPVKLEHGLIQVQGEERFRVVANTDTSDIGFKLEIYKDEDFFTLYQFDLNQYEESDCTMGNFFSSHYPDAGFVNNLVVSKKIDNNIFSLRNNEYFHIQSGSVTKQIINTALQLQSILLDIFQISLNVQVCDQLFERYIAPKLKTEELI